MKLCLNQLKHAMALYKHNTSLKIVAIPNRLSYIRVRSYNDIQNRIHALKVLVQTCAWCLSITLEMHVILNVKGAF